VTGVTVVDVGAIDPTDETAFDEWFALWHKTDLERWPEGPGWQREERRAMALDRDGPEENHCLCARPAGDRTVVGVANLKMFRSENRHLARLEVRVPVELRRQGIGTVLVEAAARLARANGRTELAGMDETPVRQDFVDVTGPFARRLGFSVVQQMVRRGIRLPLDSSHEGVLREHPDAAPLGYTLHTWGDRWPDEYIEDRCELGRRMSTDVPTGELELDEEVWDASRVRALEASLQEQNRAKVTTAARHDETGSIVAFTEIVVPLGAPESAWQHDTLVMREHRGHHLGFAVKVANLWAVAARHPDVRRINTWNAAENVHMIAVNEAIGFEVTASSRYWHKTLDA
jgi:RimJ/RimL family protein N-acetyltransferase